MTDRSKVYLKTGTEIHKEIERRLNKGEELEKIVLNMDFGKAEKRVLDYLTRNSLVQLTLTKETENARDNLHL